MTHDHKCPNCYQAPPDAHENGCVLGALAGVLEDRHNGAEINTSGVDVNALWDDLGPIIDRLGEEIGVGAFPAESP